MATSFEMYSDSTKKLSLEEVQKQKFNKFENQNFISDSKNALWFKADVQNHRSDTTTFRINNIKSGIDHIELFVLKNGVVVQHDVIGEEHRLKDESFSYPLPWFELEIKKNELLTLFLKVVSSNRISEKFFIYTKTQSIEHTFNMFAAFALFYGAALIVLTSSTKNSYRIALDQSKLGLILLSRDV
jgi:two-component system, sensor histidine kinase LadS